MAEALTLTEAAKLSEDRLLAGIILNIANFDPVLGGINDGGGALRALPFVTFDSHDYSFIRENVRGSAVWRDPNEEITGQAATFSEDNVTPKYIYRQVEVPKPFQVGYGDVNDQEAIQLREASLGMTDAIMDTFYYGDSTVNPKEPNGLHLTVDDDRIIAEAGASATAAALQMVSLDELLTDYMKFGCDVLVMPRAIKRRLAAALRATSVGNVQYASREGFGVAVTTYDGVPCVSSDYMTVTELCAAGDGKYNELATGKTGGSSASIFALKYGLDMLHAAQQTPGIKVDYWDKLEGKDSTQYRLSWYVVPVVMKSEFAIAAINNIDDATAVTA